MASTLVASPVSVAKAYSPGHITGFFEIPSSAGAHFLLRGSRGAGFSLGKGIATSVQIYESSRHRYEISINGSRPDSAEVSRWVLEEYARLADKTYFAKVDHQIDIPVGFGLGSSGAAALSLSYALNEALGLGLSRVRAAQIAHHAELACRTGLGTVIAEFAGGFELRTLAGAPGIGEVSKISLDDYMVVILCISPISTKSFLTHRMDEINGLGGKMLDELSKTRKVEDFMSMSRQFAETLGLTGGKCRDPMNSLKASGFESSVALFGETVFTLVPKDLAQEAAKALTSHRGTLVICGIDAVGARVL